MSSEPRLRVVFAHRALLTQRDEVGELCEMIAGALESGDSESIEIEATDLRTRYRPVVQDSELRFVPLGPLAPALRRGRYDILVIHGPVPVAHLCLALVARLCRVTVVFQPITMLSESYALGSWFSPRTGLAQRSKTTTIRAMRRAWQQVSTAYICVSLFEVKDTGLPPEQSFVLRWPAPRSALAAVTAGRRVQTGSVPPSDALPIAFISRFDWYRKGFDRLCEWLETYGCDLPRPAVILCAPRPASSPSRLDRLVDCGLVEWDSSVTGSDLAAVFDRCRGVLVLSRWDGQSRVLREAALAGAATISTPNSHFGAVVDNIGIGFVVDGDDAQSVQAAFEASVNSAESADIARYLFDRKTVGAELIAILKAVESKQRGKV